MKFKVGDRVAVYEQGRRYVGEVEGWTQKMVHVRVEEQITETRDSLFYYHEKQLRRLKPKVKREPRRVWVTIRKSDGFIFTAYDHFRTAIDKDNECIEFIEVLK